MAIIRRNFIEATGAVARHKLDFQLKSWRYYSVLADGDFIELMTAAACYERRLLH